MLATCVTDGTYVVPLANSPDLARYDSDRDLTLVNGRLFSCSLL